MGGLADLYSQLQKAIGATENLMEILDETPEDISDEQLTLLTRVNGDVSFDQVNFAYPSRSDVQVLKSVSFSASHGEQIAIVGPSGAGKSTVTNLLLRFYNPTSGSIQIDGKPIQDYSLSELRSHMSIVPQDVLLFGGTIKENIGYGKIGATDAEIMEAAKQANAHLFIDGFPEKYETIVGERGIQLSGGQRQRIAIARAILKNPSILIIDEATSALDSESEKLVQEALETLMKGRTSIVIAHRLSTIRKADKILVLNEGQLVESGTHEELSNQENGIYQNLSNLQLEV